VHKILKNYKKGKKLKGKNKKMKSSLKRLPALLLAVMFALMMPITAFATSTSPDGSNPVVAKSTSTANINVDTGNPDDELGLYQAVVVTYNETKNTIDYTFTDAFATYMGKDFTIDNYCALEEDELNSILGEFANYCKANNVIPIDVATTNSDGEATFEDVAYGQYIIISEGSSTGTLVYQSVTAEVVPFADGGQYKIYEEYNVSMKTAEPSIDKTILDKNITKDGDKATTDIGDTITFKVAVTVPKFPDGATNKTFYVTDRTTVGMSIVADSVKVTDANATAMTKDTDYTVTFEDDGTVYVDFNYDKVTAYNSDVVYITYDAVLTEQAVVGDDGNVNTATLVYSNAPYVGQTYDPTSDDPRPDAPDNPSNGYGTATDTETVYTYGLVIHKYDNETNDPLANAEFAIYDNADCKGDPIATITSDENGYAIYSGLSAGTYYAVETKAPTGYKIDETPKEIKVGSDTATAGYKVTTTVTEYTNNIDESLYGVQATDSNGNLLWFNPEYMTQVVLNANETYVPAYVKAISTSVVETNKDSNGYVVLEAPNVAGNNLPGTGGIGVVPFIVAGSALMVGALIVLVTRRRMNGAQD
jgi:fimbrial isopeptide formation D2 family protein/LPXTG-motif cell wall-anchored protein